MKLFKVPGFASLLAATIAFVAPASAFTSGGWEGQANHDEDGTFRDCTMTADYANGITLAFIISRDFGWGLVLANDKWNLQVGSEEAVTLAVDKLRSQFTASPRWSMRTAFWCRSKTPIRWWKPCATATRSPSSRRPAR